MMKKQCGALYVFLTAVIFAGNVQASEISYESIPLEEVLGLSSAVVVGSKDTPFLTEEEVFIGEKCAPFIKRIWHFTVTEVLYSKDALEGGARIGVCPANWRRQLQLNRLFCNEGIEVSPIYSSYSTTADFDACGELILFITAGRDGNYTFTVHGSYESVSEREKIAELLKKIAPPALPLPAAEEMQE